jgi:hypothetical protein
MKGHGTKFNRKMELAVAALLTERTIPDAARVVDVSTKTLKRWKEVPEFQMAFLAARRDRYDQVMQRFEQNLNNAATVTLKTMAEPSVQAAVRLRAADGIFNRVGAWIGKDDVPQHVCDSGAKPIDPAPILKNVIQKIAMKFTPGEQLMVIVRMKRAGRLLQPANEQESEALAAYSSALEWATELVKGDNQYQAGTTPFDQRREKPSATPIS